MKALDDLLADLAGFESLQIWQFSWVIKPTKISLLTGQIRHHGLHPENLARSSGKKPRIPGLQTGRLRLVPVQKINRKHDQKSNGMNFNYRIVHLLW